MKTLASIWDAYIPCNYIYYLFICEFIYGLFKDAVGSSECISSKFCSLIYLGAIRDIFLQGKNRLSLRTEQVLKSMYIKRHGEKKSNKTP